MYMVLIIADSAGKASHNGLFGVGLRPCGHQSFFTYFR